MRSGPVEAGFASEEARKSELILQAQLLRQGHDDEGAARSFAAAAEIEERLADACEARALSEKASVHRFSAASCWAQAGNFYRAITLCEQLLADPEQPSSLSLHIEEYARNLRSRRSAWYAVLLTEAAGTEA